MITIIKSILLSLILMVGIASYAENTGNVPFNPLAESCNLATNAIVPLEVSFRGCCSEGKRPCDCFRDWVMCCDMYGTMEMSMCKCN